MSFVTKAELMAEIWKSKLSYCEIIDPTKTKPDRFVTDRSEAGEAGIVCVITDDIDRKVTMKFPSFIVIDASTGETTVISHQRQGRITNRLAKLMMTMTDRYALRSNWRGYSWIEDMKSEALLNLSINVLMFNEAKTDNPHAYITKCIHTSFLKEKERNARQGIIKDELMIEHGLNPSYKALDKNRSQ